MLTFFRTSANSCMKLFLFGVKALVSRPYLTHSHLFKEENPMNDKVAQITGKKSSDL